MELNAKDIMKAADQLLEAFDAAGDSVSMTYVTAAELADDALAQLEYAMADNDSDAALVHFVSVLYYSAVAAAAFANDNSVDDREIVLHGVLHDASNRLEAANARFDHSNQELAETFTELHSTMMDTVRARG